MNRNSNTIFGVVVAAVLILSGCINNVDTESGGNSNVPDGKCSLTVDSGFSARAAFPSSLAADMVYAAEISYLSSGGATKWLGADSVESSPAVLKNSPSASGEIRFVFCAPEESAEYTITVFACPSGTSVGSASEVENAAAASGQAGFSLEAGQKALETPVKVSLSANASASGTGSVDLPLSFDSALGIAAAKVSVTKDGVSDSSGNNYGFKIEFSGSGAALSAENVPAGTYLAIMKFYKSTTDFSSLNEVAVNSAVQQVSVYSGMKTDCWFVDGKKHGTASANGTFTPSALNLTKYDFTELYVCGTDGGGEYGGKRSFYVSSNFGSSVPAASDTDGDGSMAKPFATVQKAVDKITAVGDISKKYTIYVDGTVTANSSDDFKEAGNGKTFIYINPSNQLDLTIKGFSQDSKAVLNANQNDNSDGNVLEANNNVSLTLENLKITGGKRNGAGGGICFENGNLTLKNCVVTNNTTYDSGGGILFCGNAELIIQDSEISENYVESSYSYGGGGICAFGNIAIKDSTVFNNSVLDDSAAGGGLYFGYDNEPATVNIQNSQIYNNSAKDGGAIGIEGGVVTLSGCEISRNTATGNGGAIFIKTINQTVEAKLTIKENVSIDLNIADADSDGVGDGGAIYATTDTSKAAGKYSHVIIGEDGNTEGIVISGNHAKRGGAFYGADNARFVMNAGEVSENYSTGSSSGDGGGAMFLWGGNSNYSTFTMKDGVISRNRAKYGGAGGAVHIDHGTGGMAALIMTGGLLEDNYACNAYNDSTGSNLGGAIYLKTGGQIKLGGSAVIAVSEESDECNDIWLADGKTITVTDTLTPGNNAVARITPQNYNIGTTLITADSGVTLKDEVGKFCVTKKSGSDDEWFIANAGTLSKPTAISGFSDVPDFNKYPKLTVSTGDDMKKLADWVKKKNTMSGYLISQMADITLPDTFTGIGVYNMSQSVTNYVFSGTFDGKGHKITSSGTKTVSIFNNLQSGGGIKNVISEGKFLYAGIAYYCDNGIIENCENNATISGSDSIGGIVGKLANGGTISNCINKGDIEASYKGGGICGWSLNGSNSILNCINLGKITGSGTNMTLGAVVATNSGTVKNTYYLIGTANQAIGGSSSVASDVDAQFDTNLKTTNTLIVEGTNSNNLIDLLNAWVTANSSDTEQYLEWEIVDDKPALVY